MRVLARVLLAIVLLVGTHAHAQVLDESSIRAFLARFDAAITSHDLDAIERNLAPHVVLSGTAYNEGQLVSFRFNKQQYLTVLAGIWAAATKHTYERTNERISISGGQATITADVTESLVLQGERVDTKARERATIENIDGTLLITQVVANQSPP